MTAAKACEGGNTARTIDMAALAVSTCMGNARADPVEEK
jgi:hypothetical protein